MQAKTNNPADLFFLLKDNEDKLALFPSSKKAGSKNILYVVPENSSTSSVSIGEKQYFMDSTTAYSLPALIAFIKNELSLNKQTVEIRVINNSDGNCFTIQP